MESARRRRASHGRSSLPSFHPSCAPRHRFDADSSAIDRPSSDVPGFSPNLRRLSMERRLSPTTPLPSKDSMRRDVRQGLAMAARNRLDERLRRADILSRRPPSWVAACSALRFDRKMRLRGEEFIPSKRQEADDCPVCLDRFESGQMFCFVEMLQPQT